MFGLELLVYFTVIAIVTTVLARFGFYITGLIKRADSPRKDISQWRKSVLWGVLSFIGCVYFGTWVTIEINKDDYKNDGGFSIPIGENYRVFWEEENQDTGSIVTNKCVVVIEGMRALAQEDSFLFVHTTDSNYYAIEVKLKKVDTFPDLNALKQAFPNKKLNFEPSSAIYNRYYNNLVTEPQKKVGIISAIIGVLVFWGMIVQNRFR